MSWYDRITANINVNIEHGPESPIRTLYEMVLQVPILLPFTVTCLIILKLNRKFNICHLGTQQNNFSWQIDMFLLYLYIYMKGISTPPLRVWVQMIYEAFTIDEECTVLGTSVMCQEHWKYTYLSLTDPKEKNNKYILGVHKKIYIYQSKNAQTK